MHKERDYAFVFGMMILLIFFGSLTVLLGLYRPPTIPSHITINVEPTIVTPRENVTVSGILQPKRVGVSIRIRWLPPDQSWGTLATVTTDSNGHFSFVWTPEVAGTYKLRSEWLGDQTNSYAISRIVGVTVEAETE